MNKLNDEKCKADKNLPLSPWWVSGYTDGEGSFMINTFKTKNTLVGYTVKLIYQITVHKSDEALLHAIKLFFKNVGNIEYTADKQYVSYRVYKLSDIVKVIIPHFTEYPLQSTKFVSFYLFKAVAELMSKKLHLTIPGYREVLSYKAASKKGLEANVFKLGLFSDIIPFNVEGILKESTRSPSETKLEPDYVSGFTAADGSFFIQKPSVSTKWPNYDATFSIAQNKRDADLLKRIALTLGCGRIKTDSNDMQYLAVRNKEEMQTKIVPFFRFISFT